jgi:hypothetical protein
MRPIVGNMCPRGGRNGHDDVVVIVVDTRNPHRPVIRRPQQAQWRITGIRVHARGGHRQQSAAGFEDSVAHAGAVGNPSGLRRSRTHVCRLVTQQSCVDERVKYRPA